VKGWDIPRVRRQSKLEVGEGAPGEVEVTEGAPGEDRARGPVTSLEIEVGEGVLVVEPERTSRPGSTNCSSREVVRACARTDKVRALGRRGIRDGGGDGSQSARPGRGIPNPSPRRGQRSMSKTERR